MPEQLVSPQTTNDELQPDAVQKQPVLSGEQQAIQAQRDNWAKENPGKSYLTPEGPTLGTEDISRLESTAEAYDFDRYDRQITAVVFNKIQVEGDKREEDLKSKYQAEEYQNEAVRDLIRQKRETEIEDARNNFVEATLPYGKRRHKKQIDKRREKLHAMLNKTPDEFAGLQADWQAYEDVLHTNELDKLHGEASADDKSLKAAVERARLKQELTELDEQNGEVLDYMAQYDLESDPRTVEVIKKYKESVGRHSDDEDLVDADRVNAFHELKWRLGEMIAAKSEAASTKLSDVEIARETQEASPYIETWLEAMAESQSDPLTDLKTYKEKERAYRSWDQHRREATEFLAPMVLLRSVQRRFSGEAKPQNQEEQPIDIDKTLKTLLDPHNVGNKNGANALLEGDQLSPTNLELYSTGVKAQLDMARNYSRHQDTILRAALIFNALTVGGYQSLSSNLSAAWDRVPEKDRKQAFKKITLGKFVTMSAKTRRLARQAAQNLEKSFDKQVIKDDNLARVEVKKDN